MSIQPKIDFFNLLNVSPVYAVRTLNYGTASYKQPSVDSRRPRVPARSHRQVLKF